MIRDLRNNGAKWDKIADLLDIPTPTLRRWAHENGVTKLREHVAPVFEGEVPTEPTIDELLELVRANQSALDKVDPILTHASIKIDSDAPIGIIFTSCAHLGSRYVNHAKFKDILERVLEIPNLYWVSLGDDVEGFINFFDADATHGQALANPKLQRQLLARVLDKLASADRLLMGFSSQHGGQWLERKVADDPIKAMYLERHVPYFEGQSYIRLTVGEQLYRLFGAHELPGNSMYNRNHPHKRAALFKAPTADLIFCGDKHCYAVQEVSLDTYEVLAGERESNKQFYVQVGTAKTGNDKYTIRGWSPGDWTWPILIFRPDRHQIQYTNDLDLAELILEGWG